MPYHTAGGWIQAFNHALVQRRHTASVKIYVCDEHADCVLIATGGQRHHVLWRETDPADAVTSVLKQLP